ncbi:hypothetical protein [Muricoccus radiodurans]|uniref:hypothetical protein n=1 Tax=Muricoccus radiodurans TaxID=2231721 RepID=UPI003CF5629F
MSLTWTLPAAPAFRTDPAPQERLPLSFSMPIVFGLSGLLWGLIGMGVACLLD